MLTEQNTELEMRGPGPRDWTCSSTSGYFHGKTKISKANFQVIINC